jgi:hypothetical protein
MKKTKRLKNATATSPARQSKTRKNSTPRTTAQYDALPEKSKDALERTLKVISKMRTEKTSLKKAALEIGVKPETVKRWAGSALEKRNGRFSAKKTDNLLRVLKVLDAKGPRELFVRGSRRASLLGEYWNAVNFYIERGDASGLQKFTGKTVKDAHGVETPLITDRAELNRIASAGIVSFESLYSRSA